MAKKIQRDPKSVALAQAILEQYQPETKEDVQDAMKDIFGPIFEAMLQGEMNAHLGYQNNNHDYKETQNRRNGYGSKTLKTTYGEIPINVPRDRDATFEPQAIPKRTKDVSGIEDKVLSMYAKGMSQRDIADTIEDIYGFNISAETVSEITDSVLTEVAEWQNRPLKKFYTFMFVDCMYVSIKKDYDTKNYAVYTILGYDVNGCKDILGIWLNESESKHNWMQIFDELKTRGVEDVLFISMDGVSGLEEGAIFQTTSDTEVICYLIAKERLKTKSLEEAVKNTVKHIKGSYSLIIMSSQKLIAVRDGNGFRPLCMGKMDNDIVFASETCALEIVGAQFLRDINPGEMVVAYNNEIKSENLFKKEKKHSLCAFEYIYFARPDSVIDGFSVHDFREMVGRYLAKQNPVEADIVCGVPDSGLDAALGYSKESKIPYDIALIKSKYIGRTFIQASQSQRKNLLKLKLNVLKSSVKGKRVVLIDDSIVRGNTITKIIKLIKDAGAKEVHLRIASPAFIDICYFGTDVSRKDELIAYNYNADIEAIRKELGADSLEYLSVKNLNKIISKNKIGGLCTGCFTGKYPMKVPKEVQKEKFEEIKIF